MSDYIDDRIEGNFVFLAVRATDGSGRRAGVDLPMDPDELARFEGEQGFMAPSDYRIDGYSKDGIVGRMGFAPFRGASMSEERGLYGALRSGGVADSFDYADYAYAAREDDDRQMWCSDDGYIVDVDLPNMPPLSARGLEDAVAALETGAAVMDPADPTNMAVTAAESGRSL